MANKSEMVDGKTVLESFIEIGLKRNKDLFTSRVITDDLMKKGYFSTKTVAQAQSVVLGYIKRYCIEIDLRKSILEPKKAGTFRLKQEFR